MKQRWRFLSVGLVFLVLSAWGAFAAEPPDCPIHLVDMTADSGITFRHNHGGSGQGYIVQGMVAGLVLFDYDADGYIDIYFLNGAPLKGTVLDKTPRNALYRNNGDGTFSDVTEQASVGDAGFGLGVTAGDYDNNGFPDLYLNNHGPNVLYRNNGDGTFSNVTESSGVRNGDTVGAGASFLDIEGDGDLDLYVSNYVDFTYENHVPIIIDGHAYQAGPRYYNPVPDTLYRNNGDGTFTDISETSGVGAHAGPGMGMVCGDFDNDGDTDVFICHDGQANFLFRNDGHGNFEEVGLMAGVAYDFDGKENSSMGVDCGDYNNDGHLDLFMTDYQVEMPVLYRNLGGGFFEDATSAARITNDFYPHVNWGTGFGDFDNDGNRDLFVACGHFDRIETLDDRTALKIPNFLLMNTGNGKFVDVSSRCGDGLKIVESSRGIGLDDLDNDGDPDVVILNSHAPPNVLRNDSMTDHHWLQIRAIGRESNRQAVGARARVVAGDLKQVAEIHSGRGYQSHFGTRLQFGLGDRDQVDRVEIRWPGGRTEQFRDLQVDQLVTLVEGEGTRSETLAVD
ncbi:MAG: CRTAC1 family protein [Planctomycetota bacterium]